MSPTPPQPPPASSGKATLSGKQQLLAIASLVMLSSLLAFGIDAGLRRPLGDEPLGMLLAGCLLAGAAAGCRAARPVVAGLAAMSGFPIWAVVDLLRNGGHNLLPFELAIYGVYGGIGVAVAAVVRRLSG